MNTYNNIRFERTQSINATRTKETSKENYKTSKTYQIIPSFHHTKNNLFNTRNRELLMNQRYYDPEMLKEQLNSCKAIIHEQKSTYLNLKIKYSKLYNENMNNKNLISSILGVPLDEYLTRDEVLDKIENVKLNKKIRKQLEEAFECIELKMQIEEKKNQNIKLLKYVKELKDNSKIKKINELVDIYVQNCEEQRKLLRILKSLGEKIRIYEQDVNQLEEIYDNEKTTKKDNQKIKEEKENNYEKLIEDRTYISRQNKTLMEKIKKYAMTNREKADRIRHKENANQEIVFECEQINEYKKEREENLKKINEKMQLDEDEKKARKEQENKIKKLNLECEELNSKMNTYSEEKPKLLKKAKEPKMDIDNMKKLEDNLNEVKNEMEKKSKEHEEKQTKLKEIEQKEKQKNDENNAIIDKNNSVKNDMHKKINDLNNKIKEIIEKNAEDLKSIENNKLEYENLTKEEIKLKEAIEKNDSEKETDIKKKDEERKKELNAIKIKHQKELDNLKREKTKINDENERIKRENDNFQQELNEFDSQLQTYEEIEAQLKDAENKLQGLKEKKE